jgi:hypothetical protein
MAETLIDPPKPPPPTVRDAVQPSGGRPRARTAKRSWIARIVAAGVAVAIVSSMAIAALIYVFEIRYEPTALRHLPSNVNLAFRVETAEIALFGPVRKHLLQFDADETPKGSTKASRVEQLKVETGLDVRTDLRELILGSVDGQGWVILVGGRIPRGRFIEGMSRLLRNDGVTSFQRQGALLVGPGGLTVAQADDGTIIVATTSALATSALPASDPSEQFPLRQDAALSFALTSGALGGIASQPMMRSFDAVLGGVASAQGTFTLGSAPKLHISAKAAPGVDAATLQSKTTGAIGALRLALLLLPDPYGAKTALGSAAVTTTPTGIDVQLDWPYAGLERACDDLAGVVRARSGAR